ncbi:MAG: hypothetical protein OFPI_21980 [Osedax symbiont Rs2]|nr:MAG: hypothetical protein OFPI_21980 [Osedax symbiont Rs2]
MPLLPLINDPTQSSSLLAALTQTKNLLNSYTPTKIQETRYLKQKN